MLRFGFRSFSSGFFSLPGSGFGSASTMAYCFVAPPAFAFASAESTDNGSGTGYGPVTG